MASNDAEFVGASRTRSRDYARGGQWDNGTFKGYTGGITYPDETKIPRGTVLVRIGHSRDDKGNPIPDWINLTSPWWMTTSTFEEIVGRSEDAQTPMQQMLRMKLALTPDYGVADTLFWVVTRDTLRSWSGRARPVMEDPDPAVREAKGRPMAWYGGYEVLQHFIPGLRDFAKKCPTPCALSSFAVLPKVPLSGYVTMRLGGHRIIPFPWPA
jgi:hypothetical protein